MTEDTQTQHSEFANVALQDYKDAVARRTLLFNRVMWFLIIDAVFFFIALIWAACTIAYGNGDWHLFAAALMPGALGAIVAVMALKAVFRMPVQDGFQMQDLAPGYETWRGAASDLSGD